MAELIDTHTHIYSEEFDSDREDVVNRAILQGVTKMILPAVTPQSLAPMKQMKLQWPDNVFLAAGLHPTDLGEDFRNSLDEIAQAMRKDDYIAVGEIGMDLYWDKTRTDDQQQAFENQLKLATELDLPVIIHCREALDETLEVISGLSKVPHGVFHSFSGTAQDVDRIRRYGDFYFGLNGVATFKNCNVTDAIPEITLNRLLLETDAPYLSPVPKRGRRNEPANIPIICSHIASTQGLTPDEVAAATTANAKKLFGI